MPPLPTYKMILASVGLIGSLSRTIFTQATKLVEASKVAILKSSLAVVLAFASQGANQVTNKSLP